jgi:flavin reductase (DIM6/NTAB) family NADH-FMN oxidoreductase RutF
MPERSQPSESHSGNPAPDLVLVDEVSQQHFREAISLFATGVTVITTRPPRGPAGMTASAVCSLSVEPVQLLVCISTHLPTHEALLSSGRFAVNVLGEGQAELALRFATPDIDKFAGVAVDESGGVPVLRDAIAHFVCESRERFPGGDHSIFIGEVVQLGHRREGRPLLYFAKQFGTLATPEDALLSSWHDRGAAL